MYTRLFFRSFEASLFNRAHIGLSLSQNVAYKPTLARAFHLVRDVRNFAASRFQFSSLRINFLKKNAAGIPASSSRGFAMVRQRPAETLNINTEVVNNVYLYKYDRTRFFKIVNICSAVQFVCWAFMAYNLYRSLPKFDEKTGLKEYARNNWLYLGFLGTAILGGFGGSLLLFAFAARSVKYLILNKGGKNATIVTYHLLDKKVTSVPVENLFCKHSRKEMNRYMAIKMTGRRFFYILDGEGTFVNPTLFDYTVGAGRY